MTVDSEATVVVTGAASGIGRVISERLSREGAHVVALDVQDGSGTVADVEAAGGTATFQEVDVTDPAALETALEGRDVDALVNNAGYYAPLVDDKKRFDEIPPEEWDAVMAVNAKGPYLASRAALPALSESDRGSIVNVSSAVVHAGIPGFLHYVASKAALLGMTRAMANEVGDVGIRVNAVTPGFTWSEASQRAGTGYRETIEGRQAIEVTLEPEHVADAVAFLVSDDSEMITGQILNVDGGLTFY